MSRTHYARLLSATTATVDLGVLLLAYSAAIHGRDFLPFAENADIGASLRFAGPVIVTTWLVFLLLGGAYRPEELGVGTMEMRRVFAGSASLAAVIGIACYLVSLELSRGFFLLLFLLGVPGLLLGRMALRDATARARRNGRFVRTVLISGLPDHVDQIAAVLDRERWLGYHVVGALTPAAAGSDVTPGGVDIVGPSEDVSAAVDAMRPDILFFADSSVTSSDGLRRAVWDLERHRTQIVVAPSVADISAERVRIHPVGGLPLVHIEKPRALAASRSAKRLFDVVGASALLVMFLPLLVACAVRIWLHDRGTVLYHQTRVGRDGETFGCLKFRTMVVNSEALQEELMAAYSQGELLFKLKDDPRVTRPGRWMRKYSFDELPQVINVLRGDMSLVGPRPPLPSETARYTPDMHRRLTVRPGMTGLWQVSGRSDLSTDEAMRLDLYYVDNWSMVQDLAILSRTLGAVVSARGAY